MAIANCYKYDSKIIPLRKHETEIKTNAKVKVFGNFEKVSVTCWDKPFYLPQGYKKSEIEFFNREKAERGEGFEKERKKALKCAEGERIEKNVNDSLRRAKNKIFEIALANGWDYMVTLTLDNEKIDRYSKTEVLKVIGKWLDNQVQRKQLKYLIVPELHKDGAIHFHGLMSGNVKITQSGTYKIEGKKAPVKKNTLTRRGLSPDSPNVRVVYNVNGFPYGFSTAVKLDGQSERVATYMTKYITKDLDKIFGSYYKAGGNIKRELDFVLMNLDFVGMKQFSECRESFVPVLNASVRYATVDLIEFNKMRNQSYDVVNDEEKLYFINDYGEICDERSVSSAVIE